MSIAHALTIEPDQRKLLEELASKQLRSPEVLVREAIARYLAGQQCGVEPEKDVLADHDRIWDAYGGSRLTRVEFLAEGDAAAHDYEETQLHLTHSEVSEWIKRLHRDADARLPECHA